MLEFGCNRDFTDLDIQVLYYPTNIIQLVFYYPIVHLRNPVGHKPSLKTSVNLFIKETGTGQKFPDTEKVQPDNQG